MREAEVKKLYDSITNIKDEFVEEAQASKRKGCVSAGKPILWQKKHPAWTKWCALAASLCLVIGMGSLMLMNLHHAGTSGGSYNSGGFDNGFWGSGDLALLDAHREDFMPGLSAEAEAAFEGVPGVMEIYRTLNNEWFLANDLTDFSQILTAEPLYIVPAKDGAYSVYTLDENGISLGMGSSLPNNISVSVPYALSGLTYDIIEEDLAGINYDDYIIAQSTRLYTVFIWARCADGEDMIVTYPARPEFVGFENRGCYTLKEIQRILTKVYRDSGSHFQLTRNWLMIPEKLYFALLFICMVISIASVSALICGAAKKKTLTYYIIWGIILLISIVYLILTLGTHSIIAHTMVGG
ncbi:MAG: hypothetical protein K2K63_17280 [Acetatifactor sp.]|nr:hypothetical protein [Acetatifactor sp.]